MFFNRPIINRTICPSYMSHFWIKKKPRQMWFAAVLSRCNVRCKFIGKHISLNNISMAQTTMSGYHSNTIPNVWLRLVDNFADFTWGVAFCAIRQTHATNMQIETDPPSPASDRARLADAIRFLSVFLWSLSQNVRRVRGWQTTHNAVTIFPLFLCSTKFELGGRLICSLA